MGTRSPPPTRSVRTTASFGHAHRLQLADFIAAVTTGGTPRVSTSDARTSLAVILALYESAAAGLPVRL